MDKNYTSSINLVLSQDEALIFYDWICKFNQQDTKQFLLDKAEQKTLQSLECLLEEQLVEPLDTKYEQLIFEAKSRILSEN